MKTKSYILISLFFLTNITLFGQSGMTIQGGGAVTVNGNLTIYECLAPPETSTLGNVPSLNQIVWNWNAVAGAIGYKWSIINDYNTAIDWGPHLQKLRQGWLVTLYIQDMFGHTKIAGIQPR